jgi:transposase
MSSYISGDDRQQAWMLPQSVEDYVGLDNPVRFIDAFVDGLDFANIGIETRPAATGRPGYAPGDLLKLYLYGYLNRVRSSRDLERLTQRNLEVIWLLKRLRPDHKTLSEFRRTHRRAFKQVFRQFNLLCRELKLFGAELVAIDGSIFKAVNSKARNYTLAKLQGLLKAVDSGIENYLKELDLNDASEPGRAAVGGTQVAKAQDLPAKISALKEARARYEQMLAQIEEDKGSQLSLTDPDARLMKKSTSAEPLVGYNVQSAVDAQHHLIVEIEATTQGNDFGQLNAIAQSAREQLGTPELSVVADGGYYSTDDLKAAEAQGISVHVPSPVDTMDKAGLHGRERFRYDKPSDTYQCPAGEKLTRHSDSEQHGRVYEVYYNSAACARCPQRAQCTSGKYRKLKHVANHEIMERIKARMKAQPQIYAQRKALVEHPFGTLKFWWGQGAFLTRGLAAVNAEISLSALAYNLKRALNVLGVPPLLAQLSRRRAGARC